MHTNIIIMVYPVTAGIVPFLRYWNNIDHFYTTNLQEIGTDTVGHIGRSGYKSEGIVGSIHDTPDRGTIPLYRYWNGLDHFYTTKSDDIGTTVVGVTGKHNYKSEGIAGYCFPNKRRRRDASTPLLRASRPSGDHFYTADIDEMVSAVLNGYKYEGILCYIRDF